LLLSLSAGLAFRKKFAGADLLFYVTVASLIMPSIIVSLGIGLQFRLIDAGLKWLLETVGATRHARGLHDLARHVHLGPRRAPDVDAAVRPAHHVRGLQPFSIRPTRRPRATRARRPWQSFWHVVLPLIAPSVVGIGMFGFTLSWDEISRSSQAIGDLNTLPLELQGLTTTVNRSGDLRRSAR